MKEKLPMIFAYIASVSTILVLLITSIDINCFDRAFFEREYSAMETASSLHMSNADLMKATNTLLDYLQDERDDIQVEIEVYDLPKMAFNERESLHMVDVKHLYQFALHIRIIAIVSLMISLLYLFYHKKKAAFHELSIAYAKTACYFLSFVAFLGIWATIDFTSLWESFHHLFFRNDLWLLNPRTDLMINMFPEDFFLHMVMRIAGMFLAVFAGLFVCSIYHIKKEYHIAFTKKGKQKLYEKNHFSEQ